MCTPRFGGEHLPFLCKYASFSLQRILSVFLPYLPYLPYLTVSCRILPVHCIVIRIPPYSSVFRSTPKIQQAIFQGICIPAYFVRILTYSKDTGNTPVFYPYLAVSQFEIRTRYVFFSDDENTQDTVKIRLQYSRNTFFLFFSYFWLKNWRSQDTSHNTQDTHQNTHASNTRAIHRNTLTIHIQYTHNTHEIHQDTTYPETSIKYG
jgi:hypothetical protein